MHPCSSSPASTRPAHRRRMPHRPARSVQSHPGGGAGFFDLAQIAQTDPRQKPTGTRKDRNNKRLGQTRAAGQFRVVTSQLVRSGKLAVLVHVVGLVQQRIDRTLRHLVIATDHHPDAQLVRRLPQRPRRRLSWGLPIGHRTRPSRVPHHRRDPDRRMVTQPPLRFIRQTSRPPSPHESMQHPRSSNPQVVIEWNPRPDHNQ